MKPIKYLNQREVADKVGVSRETIARWSYQGKLPKPDAVVGYSGAWLEKTIDEWMKAGWEGGNDSQ